MRSHPLPEARQYAGLMLTELRKVIPSFLKRVDLDDRGVAWSTYLASTRAAMEDVSARLFPADHGPTDDGPEVRLLGVGPRRRDPHGRGDAVLRTATCRRHQIEQRVRAMTAERAPRGRERLRRRPQQPAPQAGPGARAAPLPLRRARRLRRLPRPPAPPHAHHRVAGPVAPPRLHPARGGRRRRRPARFDEAMAPLGRRSTTSCTSASPQRPPTPSASPTRCASSWTSTPGRPCTCSSCAPHRRATPPTARWPSRCTP